VRFDAPARLKSLDSAAISYYENACFALFAKQQLCDIYTFTLKVCDQVLT
jgi:hypothetical protein